MKRLGLKAAVLSAIAATAVMAASPAEARRYHRDHDRTGAVIAAGVVGLAIGAALASSSRDRYYYRDRYYDDYYYDRYPRYREYYYYDRPYPRYRDYYYYDRPRRRYRDRYHYDRPRGYRHHYRHRHRDRGDD